MKPIFYHRTTDFADADHHAIVCGAFAVEAESTPGDIPSTGAMSAAALSVVHGTDCKLVRRLYSKGSTIKVRSQAAFSIGADSIMVGNIECIGALSGRMAIF
jgi:hypothetical protein